VERGLFYERLQWRLLVVEKGDANHVGATALALSIDLAAKTPIRRPA